jgi:SAM-dependent methyltransferase
LAEVTERLRAEHAGGGSVAAAMAARGIPPNVWSAALADFYRETDAFFYELCTWNRMSRKCRMRAWIAAYLSRSAPGPLDVLAYGDGLGFDSLHLSQAGHRVCYFDASPRMAAFAASIFRGAAAPVECVTDAGALRGRRFDAIVCLDVLEHVPDPEALVREMAGMLADRGCLLVHAPFWAVGPDTPTHLAANRRYTGDWRALYGPAGLTPVDAGWTWDPLVLRSTNGARTARPVGLMPRLRIAAGGRLVRLEGRFAGPLLRCGGRRYRREAAAWMSSFGTAPSTAPQNPGLPPGLQME